MNKLIRGILTFGIAIVCTFGGVGCSFRLKPMPKTEVIVIDGLIYTRYVKTNVYHVSGDDRKNNPEIMHINPYCNGIEVRFFGERIEDSAAMSTVMFNYAPSLINVKILSLPYCMERLHGLEDSPIKEAPQKIILVRNSNGDEGFVSLHAEYYEEESYLREIYCTSLSYQGRIDALLGDNGIVYLSGECYSNEKNPYRFKICKANTAYMFNYETCPNDGYFFIDDFEYGETVENAPYEPLRDGYIFDGWYKESACVNAWDFETDTLPQALYNEEEQEIYQETKLYAKWIKK